MATSPLTDAGTTPPPQTVEAIPSQTQIRNKSVSSDAVSDKPEGVVPASPAPSEPVARSRGGSASTPPPLVVEGVSRGGKPEAVTPGATGQLLSRLKKRVLETAWQSSETKVC